MRSLLVETPRPPSNYRRERTPRQASLLGQAIQVVLSPWHGTLAGEGRASSIERVVAGGSQFRGGQIGVAGDGLPLAGRLVAQIDPLLGYRVAAGLARLLDPRHAVQGLVDVTGHLMSATVVTELQSGHAERTRGGTRDALRPPRRTTCHARDAAGVIGYHLQLSITERARVAQPCYGSSLAAGECWASELRARE